MKLIVVIAAAVGVSFYLIAMYACLVVASQIDGRMNNMPAKRSAHQRPARKRRKGKLPMKGRESVLKRLKEYQDELAAQRGQAVVSQDVPDLQERRKA